MTTHTIVNAATTCNYATVSHHSERFHDNTVVDYSFDQCQYDNYDITTDFVAAMKRIEGLLYAACGSQPDYANGTQWYGVEHPRCRWGPEQWVQVKNDAGDIYWNYTETAALGDLYTFAQCHIPIRSRSGDPNAHLATATHHEYFPYGSVTRYCNWPGNTGHQAFDPASNYKKFARWPDPETVTVRYERPSGVPAPSAVYLWRSIGGHVQMTEVSPGIYEADIQPQTQDTWVEWYVYGMWSGDIICDPYPGDGYIPAVTGRESDPEHRGPTDCNVVVFYSHYNPYSGGLPELIDTQEPHLTNHCRRCTDAHTFDRWQDIKPGLINRLRFALDWLVQFCHHNPRNRGTADDGTNRCCPNMPKKFWWSGSNKPYLYLTGGKGTGPLGTHPLTNHPDEPVPPYTAHPRRSWRGIPMLYGNASDYEIAPGISIFADNWEYGDNESWLSNPFYLYLQTDPRDPTKQSLVRRYEYRGLLEGDAIDIVHLQEIIDAVDDLISDKLWNLQYINTMPKTVGSVDGKQCGYYRSLWIYEGETLDDTETVYSGSDCCESWAGGICTPLSKPAWDDCAGNEKCEFFRTVSRGCGQGNTEPTTEYSDSEAVQCGISPDDPPYYRMGAWIAQSSIRYEGYPVENIAGLDGIYAFGAAYYLCGPDRTPGGPEGDSYHGNWFTKYRYDAEGTQIDTGPNMGNRLLSKSQGGLVSCVEEDPTENQPVDYQKVTGVYNKGIAWHWLSQPLCNIGEHRSFQRLAADGLGEYNYDHTEYLTNVYEREIPGGDETWIAGSVSVDEFPVCLGNAVWVALDMNLHDGVPTLYDYNLNIDNPWNDCPCGTWLQEECS